MEQRRRIVITFLLLTIPTIPVVVTSFSATPTTASKTSSSSSPSWFVPVTSDGQTTSSSSSSMEMMKATMLQLGASLDRGQAYNPTSGEYYKEKMDITTEYIKDFITSYPNNIPKSINDIIGEWELVLTTVPHGIFRSSPFFLAIEDSYENHAIEKEIYNQSKSQLFFRLHELQTCSFGISKVGRVAQTITNDYLYSEFDTSIFSLTVIPIIGWFKLLPTFGGCVITAAKVTLVNDELRMIVDYTTSRPVPGLQGLGEWIWNIKVPVGAIWKLLPWNRGREPECKVYIRYADNDFRIVEDITGHYFVYTRPVVPRPLDLASATTTKTTKV